MIYFPYLLSRSLFVFELRWIVDWNVSIHNTLTISFSLFSHILSREPIKLNFFGVVYHLCSQCVRWYISSPHSRSREAVHVLSSGFQNWVPLYGISNFLDAISKYGRIHQPNLKRYTTNLNRSPRFSVGLPGNGFSTDRNPSANANHKATIVVVWLYV